MMEREDRPTTADIAEGEEVRDEAARSELDEDLRERARPRDEAKESAELDEDPRERARPPDDAEDSAELDEGGPLLADELTSDFQSRWRQVQSGFVDEPRRSVEEADALVAELMQRLADSFSQERARLESQWDRGDEVSTEDLRIALQRYRSFFGRLLSA